MRWTWTGCTISDHGFRYASAANGFMNVLKNIATMPLGNTNDCIPEDVQEEEEPAPGSASAEPNISQTVDAPAGKEEMKLPTHLKTK